MSNITRSHETSIVVTPATLKHQIIIRLHTLLSKVGGKYYHEDESGHTIPLTTIEGMEIHGLETKGRDVYLMGVPADENIAMNLEDEHGPYNADEFYVEQLWEIYMACEPIYQSKFNDYGTMQD